MIRCFTSLPRYKISRSYPRMKKTSTVIGGRLSASCSPFFPPGYSFGPKGCQIEERASGEEKGSPSKTEGGKAGQEIKSGKACASGRNRSEASSGDPGETGRSLS